MRGTFSFHVKNLYTDLYIFFSFSLHYYPFRTTAYAELNTDGVPTVSIFEWSGKKRRKVLTCLQDVLKSPVVALAFTSDNKYLLIQSGGPEWNLYVVLWDKSSNGRLDATLRNVTSNTKPVIQIDTNPEDPNLVTISGNGVMKLYRFQDDSFRSLPVNLRRDPCPLAGHAWMGDNGRLLVATSAGELLILENGDMKKILDPPTVGNLGIGCLLTTNKGFLLGCENGTLRVYERAEDARLYYRFVRQHSIYGPGSSEGELAPSGKAGMVTSMTLSPTEEDVVLTLGNGQGYIFKFGSAELNSKSGEHLPNLFKPFISPFHTTYNPALDMNPMSTDLIGANGVYIGGPCDPRTPQNNGIVGIDTCIRRPIFVTAGTDKAVRVWNYLVNSSLMDRENSGSGGNQQQQGLVPISPDLAPIVEVSHKFTEVPTCIALHPMGFYLLVGFETSLQLCCIMLDGISIVKDLPVRSASDVRFSHNGAMFAVAAGSSVNVYNTFTCAPVTILRGHADRVLAMTWSKDDRYLVTAGKDGMVARWAVVVPNAISAGSSNAKESTQSNGTASRPSSAAIAAGPLSRVGHITHSIDIRDFYPLSISNGSSESGKDVYISGSIVKGIGASATHTPIFRHIDLSVPKTEAVKAEHSLSGTPIHSLITATHPHSSSPYAVLAGLGKRILSSSSSSSSSSAANNTNGNSSSPAAKRLPTSPGNNADGTTETHAVTRAEHDPVGCLRIYRPSLGSGDKEKDTKNLYQDVVCHNAPITRILFARDGKLLITGASDGSIGLWTVTDPFLTSKTSTTSSSSSAASTGTKGLSGNGGEEPLGWTDDVCVTKRDLNVIVKEKAELESKQSEITLVNKYAEREKEANNEARLADAESDFADQIETARSRVTDLRNLRAATEVRFQEQIATLEANQTAELEDLEKTYSAKIKGEIGRYDRLVAERDRANAEFEAAMTALASEQASEVSMLRRKFETAIADEHSQSDVFSSELQSLGHEIKKSADSIERDVDGEIEEMRARFEVRLREESETTLKVRGENGLMKRKYVNDTKVITEQKEELASLADKEKELHEAISALQKDVAGHKKEIKEREETITDKETRIYDLKKKNQELEKFKFVLNYKIQELKRQIMPKKKEISDMRDQLKEMEMELLQYHKSNAALDLMISELKLKRDGMAAEVDKLQNVIHEKEETMVEIGRDVTAVHSLCVNPKSLQIAMYHLYHKYIHSDAASLSLALMNTSTSNTDKSTKLSESLAKDGVKALGPGVNLEDLQREMAQQRQHLERGVESIRRRIEKEGATAASDRNRLLRENALLTQEINDLRRDLRYLQGNVEKLDTTIGGSSSSSGHPSITNATVGNNGNNNNQDKHTTNPIPPVPGSNTNKGLATTGGRRTAAVLGIVNGGTTNKVKPTHTTAHK